MNAPSGLDPSEPLPPARSATSIPLATAIGATLLAIDAWLVLAHLGVGPLFGFDLDLSRGATPASAFELALVIGASLAALTLALAAEQDFGAAHMARWSQQ